MVEVVIKYDTIKGLYQVYEPSTKTLLVSDNIGQALVNLSQFLLENGLENVNILRASDISYHLDSSTMCAIIESNFALQKRLSDAPTGFIQSERKFGTRDKSGSGGGGFSKKGGGNFTHGSFKQSYKKFGKCKN